MRPARHTPAPAMTPRQCRGATAHQSGQCAEDSVCRAYERRGCSVLARRWRGKGGEVDLIVRDGAATVFVEVKRARDHATAAERIQPRQMTRIAQAAGEYLDTFANGSLSEARFDVALVDGIGAVSVVENAFGCA